MLFNVNESDYPPALVNASCREFLIALRGLLQEHYGLWHTFSFAMPTNDRDALLDTYSTADDLGAAIYWSRPSPAR